MTLGPDEPRWIPPMLATLVERPFAREGWIFERKLDGERVLALKTGSEVHLFSRNARPLDGTYPELVEALAAEDAEAFMVDGEVVAFEGRQTSFARLQKRMHISDPREARRSGVPVFYYVFDLLHLDGYDTTALPLRERKALVRQALRWSGPLRFLPHRNTTGDTLYASACHWGWEGIMAKRADGRYVSGRSRDWLKFKCLVTGEFLVCGYTDPAPGRPGFGALVLGEWRGGSLVYAGKVGTGFGEADLVRIAAQLAQLARADTPFAGGAPEPALAAGGGQAEIGPASIAAAAARPGATVPAEIGPALSLPAALPDAGRPSRRQGPPARGVHWVDPVFAAQVAYAERTHAGHLRHPRFRGMRRR